MTAAAFGYLSLALQLASFAIMIQPVALPAAGAERKKPPRLSWLIWSLLYQVMLWATLASGATASIWIVVAEAIGTTAMLAISVPWGTGSLLPVRRRPGCRLRLQVQSWTDLLVLLGAVAAIAAWKVPELAGWRLISWAVLGMVLTVAVDFIAAIPLIGVAWGDPRSQSLLGWASSGLASAAAICSVSRGQRTALYAYPVAGLVLDAIVVLVITAAYRRAAASSRRRAAKPGESRQLAGGGW